MKISVKTEDRVITATLIDNGTIQDFISLLALTPTMNDFPLLFSAGIGFRAISTNEVFGRLL